MEGFESGALGIVRKPHLWPPNHVVGNLDVAAFAGVPGYAAGHEGRG